MTPTERDLAIRTIIGEAQGEPPVGQQAVASVILNRLKEGTYGDDVSSVVLAPNQFEAWTNPRKLFSYAPDSPEYQTASQALDEAEAGSDPTGGADHFLNPELQTQLGRQQPGWATPGGGQRIGNHVFYGGNPNMASTTQANDPATMAIDLASHTGTGVPAAAVDPFTKAFGPQTPAGAPSAPTDNVDPFTKAFGPNAGTAVASEATAPDAVTQTGLAKTLSPVNAFMNSWLGGIPIAGPFLQKAANAASVAGLRLSGVDADTAQKQVNALTTQAQAEHPVIGGVGNVTGAVTGTIPMMLAAPEAFGLGAGSLAARSAASGGTNALIGYFDALARGQNPTTGAAAGGIGGAVAPGLGQVAGNLISSKLAPEVARLAQRATQDFGIPLSADQLSSTPMVKFAGSVINRFPFTGGAQFEGTQRGAFTGAVARLMGTDASALTPDVMSATKKRIGNVFESVANNTSSIGFDNQMGQDLMDVYNAAPQVLTDQEWAPIKNQLTNVIKKFKAGGGSINGEQYLALTKNNSPLDLATKSSNSNISNFARQIEEALGGALERSASPEDVAALRQARSQWRVMRTVEPLAEKAPTGEISPALLMGRVQQADPNMAYRTGDDLGDLARIGQLFLKPPPSSGTGERSWVMDRVNDLAKVGASLGSGAATYALTHEPGLVATGVMAPPIVGRFAGSVMRNPALVQRLITGAMSPVPQAARPVTNALVQTGSRALSRAVVPPFLPGAPQPAQ